MHGKRVVQQIAVAGRFRGILESLGETTEFCSLIAIIGAEVLPPVGLLDGMGQAMGTAAMILSAGTKGQRAALPHASIVLHQPRSGARGQATDIAIQAEQLRYTKRRMAELIAEHSGQTLEQIQQDSERDRWFTAEEAKEYGLIDEMIDRRKDDSGDKK